MRDPREEPRRRERLRGVGRGQAGRVRHDRRRRLRGIAGQGERQHAVQRQRRAHRGILRHDLTGLARGRRARDEAQRVQRPERVARLRGGEPDDLRRGRHLRGHADLEDHDAAAREPRVGRGPLGRDRGGGRAGHVDRRHEEPLRRQRRAGFVDRTVDDRPHRREVVVGAGGGGQTSQHEERGEYEKDGHPALRGDAHTVSRGLGDGPVARERTPSPGPPVRSTPGRRNPGGHSRVARGVQPIDDAFRRPAMNRTLLAIACVSAVALAPFALAAPGDGAGHPGRHARQARLARREHRFLKSLELTDAQKAQWKDARLAADPVREDLRTQIRAMREAFKAGEKTPEARAAFRAKRKATVDAALAAVAPSAARLVASLTPEQRAKLEARAKAHGKTLDDAKLTRRIERLLLARGRKHPGGGGCEEPTPTTPTTPGDTK